MIAKAFVERQARFDATHDDVDGVGELRDELRLPPLGQLPEIQRGRPNVPTKPPATADDRAGSAARTTETTAPARRRRTALAIQKSWA